MRSKWLDLKWWMERNTEHAAIWIARHMPRELKKWVIATVAGSVTSGNPSEVTALEMLKTL